jgi:hypothetical protein
MAQPGVPGRATQASRARAANPNAQQTINAAAKSLRATAPYRAPKAAKAKAPKEKPVPSTYLGSANL